MKQTAVGYLVGLLETQKFITKSQIFISQEMEKEQIMDAIKFTIQDEFTKQTWKNGKCSHDTALNYYKQTFKSE